MTETNKRVFNPRSLTVTARKCVNSTLQHVQDINKLDIPGILQTELDSYWVNDKLKWNWYNQKLPLVEDFIDEFNFHEPNHRLTRNALVAFHTWEPQSIDEIATILYEFNHITRYEYQIGDPTYRHIKHGVHTGLCFYCIHKLVKQSGPAFTWGLYTTCETVHIDSVMDTIQDYSLWCSRCHHTTLFKIDDSPILDHRFSAYRLVRRYYKEEGRVIIIEEFEDQD